MISPKIEQARIKYALRSCREHDLPIIDPMELIENAVDKFGDNLSVSCSFGSCSVAVLHMTLQVKPDIKVVFNNTGVQYPETYAYRDRLKTGWDLNPYIETKPIKSFWDCVKEYGFPMIRGKYSYSQKGRSFHKPECCIFTKEKPMASACKRFGIDATLTGLRASESGVRFYTIAQRGMFYHTKKWGSLWRFHPLAFWNREQVFGYLHKNNIPISEVYTKLALGRSGCMPCTGFLHWEKYLAKSNLKMYRYVQKLRGVGLIDDFINWENKIYHDCGFKSRQELLEDWF